MLSFDLIRMYTLDMSKPADPQRSNLDYLPTQYICEYIKKLGYDGVSFRSSLVDTANNINLILFEEDKVECVEVVRRN